jgi:hypothetical protein
MLQIKWKDDIVHNIHKYIYSKDAGVGLNRLNDSPLVGIQGRRPYLQIAQNVCQRQRRFSVYDRFRSKVRYWMASEM